MTVLAALWAVTMPAFAQVKPKGKGRTGAQQDSTKKDSVKKPQKEIPPQTEFLLLEDQAVGKIRRHKVDYDLHDFLIWEPLDTLEGFSQTLGHTGKPYRRYVNGISSVYLDDRHWQNPINRAEEVYYMDPEKDVSFLDTKTPYFNIQYHQGLDKLSHLRATLSQNVAPWVNVTGRFHSRRMNGAYQNNTTRNTEMFLSANGHSLDNRYHAFVAGVFNEMDDDYNGGARVSSSTTFDDLFRKNLTQILLTDARHVRRQKSIFFRHFYHLQRDSVAGAQSLTLTNSVRYDDFFNQFSDGSFSNSLLNEYLPVYLTMDTLVTNDVFEKLSQRHFRADAGGTYQLRFRENLLAAGGEFGYEYFQYRQYENSLTYDRTFYTLNSRLELHEKLIDGTAKADYSITEANLYDPESKLTIGGRMSILPPLFDFADTTITRKGRKRDTTITTSHFRPLFVEGNWRDFYRNPSYLQTFYRGGTGQILETNNNFRNEHITSLRLGAGVQGKSESKRGIRNGRNQASLNIFYSRHARMIYWDSLQTLHQIDNGDALNVLGAEAFVRLKWRRFSFESRNTFQQFVAPSNTDLSLYFTDRLPQFYGKSGLYYENRDVKIAAVVRLGLEVTWHSGYFGDYFDPIHQEFFPQRTVEAPAYARVDAIASTRIKTAKVYISARHANESLYLLNDVFNSQVFLPGYYTTPLYPEIPFQFIFGVNWTFFN